jgi:hypothetical protein
VVFGEYVPALPMVRRPMARWHAPRYSARPANRSTITHRVAPNDAVTARPARAMRYSTSCPAFALFLCDHLFCLSNRLGRRRLLRALLLQASLCSLSCLHLQSLLRVLFQFLRCRGRNGATKADDLKRTSQLSTSPLPFLLSCSQLGTFLRSRNFNIDIYII